MVVTVSLILLFGIALFFLLRSKELGPGSAFTAAMFGFLLASTGAAEPINRLTASLTDALSNL
ncbi:hypothetical protein ACF064_24505 [Streptomyces sp. NPDC015492]|uniref:hypothetical protein n=1 Tax=Streptomyces sp. NPDC015492 TaxID=3364958 RepID=UPI0036F6D1E8